MKKYLLFMMICLLVLSACGRETPAEPEQTQPAQTAPIATVTETEAAPPAAEPEPRLESCDVAQVDCSGVEDGYVSVRYFGQTDSRLKVLVKGPTTTYRYDLPRDQWTVFPLSDGDGAYQVGVYRNTTGTKYATVMTVELDVALRDAFAPFLRPNQYVNYQDAPRTVALADSLCEGRTDALEKVEAVYGYVVENLCYDEQRAATVRSGYLPVLDQVLEEKKGICFDYAALMAAMLRCQRIPCKLVVGYAGEIYHAWISVWTEESGWIEGVLFFDGHAWKHMDPTFASTGGDRETALACIQKTTYTEKYLY